MLENAIYSVISPEGCATILWRDPKKMLDAAKAMKLSSKDLLELNIIDEIIFEPLGGAHRDKEAILSSVETSISKNLSFFEKMTSDDILNHRKNKFLQIGRGKGFINNSQSLSATQLPVTRFKEIFFSKKNFVIVTFTILILISILVFT